MATNKKVVDYGDDAKPQVTDNILAKLDFLANAALDAEAEVDAAEATLKLKKERLRDLVERQLPETMDEARQKTGITTASGLTIKIEDKVRASIPKEKCESAFAWLRERNLDPIIKTAINIPFEAGRDPAAQGLRHLLVLLSVHEPLRKIVRDYIMAWSGKDANVIEPVYSFLTAVGNAALSRFLLESNVHSQTLAAQVRELLKDGKIDEAGMAILGAHAWREAKVKRKS